MSYNAFFSVLGAMDAHEGYLRQMEAMERRHFRPRVKVAPEYEPVVWTTDWKADTEAALRQAKVGTFLLAAFAVALCWAVRGWLA
jgi:hypothetical protein